MTGTSDTKAATWKLGSVAYLNAKPLLFGLSSNPDIDLKLDTPSRLSDRMHAGEFDAALVPIVEAFREPGYHMIPDACVASDGYVESVCLFLYRPIAQIQRVGLDVASRTSRLLTKVLLKRLLSQPCGFVDVDPSRDINMTTGHCTFPLDAFLAIGDPALTLRKTDLDILDLGAAWKEAVNLPFVYAVWLARDAATAEALAPLLCEARDQGLQHLDACCEPEQDWQMDYLRQAIQYQMSDAHQQGLQTFQSFLLEDQLIPDVCEPARDS